MYLTLSLLISVLAWSAGFGFFVHDAQAGSLTFVSDTLSVADLGMTATHTIQWTNSSSSNSGSSTVITFDPLTSLFSGVGSVTFGDVQVTGMTLVVGCGVGLDEVQLTTSTNALTFTVCAGKTVASGTKTVVIASGKIFNPTTTGSYVIRINGTMGNNADTRIAIIPRVVVTAAVDTTLTFIVGPVATGTTINGVTTTRASTSSTLPFGTLPVGSPVTLGQTLSVATNARNGFVVTVHEDQNPLSATGADIDLFPNGNPTSTPVQWYAPSSTLDVENTYGHFGLTSDDADLNSGEFGPSSTPKFVGNFYPTTTRQIFSHTGPADGVTQNKGFASIAYRMQIGPLQEAGNDYTNDLFYVCTPTF